MIADTIKAGALMVVAALVQVSLASTIVIGIALLR
jgi:hypothetical protein